MKASASAHNREPDGAEHCLHRRRAIGSRPGKRAGVLRLARFALYPLDPAPGFRGIAPPLVAEVLLDMVFLASNEQIL